MTPTGQAREPIYARIARGLRDQIEDGKLAPGTRLPTIRALAQHEGVTRVTIQRAYDWLNQRGWIESTVGRGTFVCLQLPHEPPPGDGRPESAGEVLEGMQWAAPTAKRHFSGTDRGRSGLRSDPGIHPHSGGAGPSSGESSRLRSPPGRLFSAPADQPDSGWFARPDRCPKTKS